MSTLPDLNQKNHVTSLSVMMFLQFFVWGAWYVSMTGFMGAQQMGGLGAAAYSVGPIAAIISPFFLGLVADRFFATQRVLGALHLLGALALFAAPAMAKPFNPETDGSAFAHPFIIVLLLHMLCYMPTLGLTGSISFHNLSNREKQFPLVRVWGTIGWIVGNIVVGGNLKTFGLDVVWIPEGDASSLQFYVAGGAAVLLGLFSFVALPNTPPPAKGQAVTVRQIIGVDSIKLLAKPSYLVFIICSFLLCIPLAFYYIQARNYVAANGFTNPTLTMSFGQMSEILFMVVMPLCFARLGVKWMLAIGMLAWVVRYGLFAGAWDGHVGWMVVGAILLHGICYDFFFVTGMIYVDQSAHKEIRSQAQGFLVLATQGLGMLIGAQAFGWWVNKKTESGVLDWPGFWMAPAIFAAAILVVFVLFFRAAPADRKE
ncbi:MAG TPA: MFS transporter [Phycisphaerales bacterium]|nr:MFS transporter [Phycisphaerales bacterium]